MVSRDFAAWHLLVQYFPERQCSQESTVARNELFLPNRPDQGRIERPQENLPLHSTFKCAISEEVSFGPMKQESRVEGEDKKALLFSGEPFHGYHKMMTCYIRKASSSPLSASMHTVSLSFHKTLTIRCQLLHCADEKPEIAEHARDRARTCAFWPSSSVCPQ